jgi:hypothetical protein
MRLTVQWAFDTTFDFWQLNHPEKERNILSVGSEIMGAASIGLDKMQRRYTPSVPIKHVVLGSWLIFAK